MTETRLNHYLTFGIDGDLYALPVSRVQEVLEYSKPAKLPGVVDYLKGLINVRGRGIPVIDLRAKFGMPEIGITRDTAILILEIDTNGGRMVTGAMADQIHEVIELDRASLERVPRFGNRIDANLIKFIGKRNDRFVIVLDVDRVFSPDETAALRKATSS